MSDDEIFEAKVIILDILGWGVPSQYLLDCGISPLAIVVCLSDLRLRIPRDLEFLIRDAEQHVVTASQQLPGGYHVNGKILSAQAPPFVPHRADPVSPTPPPATPPTDLDNIEQQRKQELLARRAVLQSMKKPKGLPSSISHVDNDVPYSSPRPYQENGHIFAPHAQEEDAVDAFLDGLMTGRGGDDANMEDGQANDQMEVEQALVATTPEEMDEEPTPTPFAESSNAPPQLSAGYDTSSTFNPGPSYSQSTGSFAGGANGWDSGPSTSSAAAHRTLPPSANTSHIRQQQQQAGPTRKNTKRPVAADFVEYNASQDASPVPSQLRIAPARSYTSESTTSNGVHRRRHLGPVIQQRLVIDLSDDEGSTDGEHDGTTRVKNGHSRTTVGGPSSSGLNANIGREGSTSSVVDEEKQKLLQQKQKEIELMRERIRLAEERKKRTVKRDDSISSHPTSPIPSAAKLQHQNEQSVIEPQLNGNTSPTINSSFPSNHLRVERPWSISRDLIDSHPELDDQSVPLNDEQQLDPHAGKSPPR